MKSPPKPWETGRHPTYTGLRLVVNLCQDTHGNVWSDHTFASSEDEQVAIQELPHGGVPQVAHALLTEAVRREAFQVILIELGQDRDLLRQWKTVPETERKAVEKRLATAVSEVISRTTAKMASGAIAEVLAMMSDQQPEGD